jgi:hypothetical protein
MLCLQHGSLTWHCLLMPGKAWTLRCMNEHVDAQLSLVKRRPLKNRLDFKTAPLDVETCSVTTLVSARNGLTTSNSFRQHDPNP